MSAAEPCVDSEFAALRERCEYGAHQERSVDERQTDICIRRRKVDRVHHNESEGKDRQQHTGGKQQDGFTHRLESM